MDNKLLSINRLKKKVSNAKEKYNKDSGNNISSGGLSPVFKKRKNLISIIGNTNIVNKALMNKETKTVSKMKKAGIPDADINEWSSFKAKKRADKGIKGGPSLNF